MADRCLAAPILSATSAGAETEGSFQIVRSLDSDNPSHILGGKQQYLRHAQRWKSASSLLFAYNLTEDSVRKLVHRSILLGAASIALCQVTGITQARALGFASNLFPGLGICRVRRRRQP